MNVKVCFAGTAERSLSKPEDGGKARAVDARKPDDSEGHRNQRASGSRIS
jgi:hypothetical protein